MRSKALRDGLPPREVLLQQRPQVDDLRPHGGIRSHPLLVVGVGTLLSADRQAGVQVIQKAEQIPAMGFQLPLNRGSNRRSSTEVSLAMARGVQLPTQVSPGPGLPADPFVPLAGPHQDRRKRVLPTPRRSRRTPMIYAHLSPDFVQGATDALAKRFQVGPEGKGYLGEESVAKPRCGASNCNENAVCKGYCMKHYWQIKRHGTLTPEKERNVKRGKTPPDSC